MRNPKALKFSNFPQSTRQDDQLSQRIWMEEMNTFMDRTLKKQQPRRWKTEDREKTYTERNEIEISNNESRSQIAFKRNSTIPRIGLASPRQPIPQAPEGDEVNKPAYPVPGPCSQPRPGLSPEPQRRGLSPARRAAETLMRTASEEQ